MSINKMKLKFRLLLISKNTDWTQFDDLCKLGAVVWNGREWSQLANFLEEVRHTTWDELELTVIVEASLREVADSLDTVATGSCLIYRESLPDYFDSSTGFGETSYSWARVSSFVGALNDLADFTCVLDV